MIHRNVVNVGIWEDCQHCENAIVGLQENAMMARLRLVCMKVQKCEGTRVRWYKSAIAGSCLHDRAMANSGLSAMLPKVMML